MKLGTGLKTADDFRKAHEKVGCKIGDYGNDVLEKPAFEKSVAEKETEVELVNVSVEELGFKDGATRADIYKRAKELGLGLCPAEVGPQLRLKYKDQPKGEWVLIAMEPITGSNGYLHVFNVKRYDGGDDDGVLCLNARNGDPDFSWGGDTRWVFLRCK